MIPELPSWVFVLAAASLTVMALSLMAQTLKAGELTRANLVLEGQNALLLAKLDGQEQAKNILAVLSAEIDRHVATVETVETVLHAHDGDLHKTDAILQQYLARGEKLLAKAAENETAFLRVHTVMQDQITWLRNTRRDAESYERATQNIEAERLVRASGTADAGIQAGPAAYDAPLEAGPKGPPRRAAVKRRAEDPDAPSFSDLNEVAKAVLQGNGMKGTSPPVPGTE